MQEINLGTLVDAFNDERIDPEAVTALTDQDLIRLGVHTIGDRVRLRAACQRKVAESRNSQHQSFSSSASQERSMLFGLRSSVTARSSCLRKKHASKRTWTMQFICLADCLTTKVPTTTERQILHKAGLG